MPDGYATIINISVSSKKSIYLCAQHSVGSFVVHKPKKPLSAIALDHAHEKVNSAVKGEGGAVGQTKSAAALSRWMVAGPELS